MSSRLVVSVQGRKGISSVCSSVCSSVLKLNDGMIDVDLNKYELNRLDSYCKFKKYEKHRPISSVFVLSIYITMCHRIYIKRPADDTIPVTDCVTGYI